jgi:hemerythrin-like domain-containing protein
MTETADAAWAGVSSSANGAGGARGVEPRGPRGTDVLRAEHASIRRALAIVDAELERMVYDAAPDYARLLRAIRYLTGFSDCVHHPREDAAVRAVERRAPEAVAPLAALAASHDELAESGERLRDDVGRILDGGDVDVDRLARVGRAYAHALLQHLAFEEAMLFPLIEALLDERDWAAIQVEVPRVLEAVFLAEHRLLRKRAA